MSDEELREWVIQLRSLRTTSQSLRAAMEKEATLEADAPTDPRRKQPSIDDLMNLE